MIFKTGIYIKKVFLWAIFLSFSFEVSGQTCIKGLVFDSKSHKPIVGVAVLADDGIHGTVTDSSGHFMLCVQPKTVRTITVSHLGYEPAVRQIEVGGEEMKIYLNEFAFILNPLVVTATLGPQRTWEVPSKVSVIDSVSIKSESALNVDNYLRTIPGLYIDRSNGVYSKNASITMRGLDGANRVLILYDGVPLNKTSYGFINWSLITPDMVDQIEIVHGPSSALFGNNAMAGVINIRTKEPLNSPFYGSFTGEAGGFGLYGTRLTLGGNIPFSKKGIKIMANGFWRQGDGYITTPSASRDSTCVPSYLMEKGIVVKTIIPISDSSTFYVDGNMYQDKRGSGFKVNMKDGSFDAYTTDRVRLGLNSNFKGFKLETYAYFQLEKYNNQSDKVNKTNDYKLSNTHQISGDMGLWVNAVRNIGKDNQLIAGVDLKYGWMDAEDIYHTSTDDLKRYGKVAFGAFFLQDEHSFFGSKLKLLGGFRYDAATFYDGYLKVSDPTTNTGFLKDTLANFPKNTWQSINPKFGVRYLPMPWLSFYGSIASGFMPAKLDDLCSSRKITKGFKLANPYLKPEHLLTYEAGGGVLIFGKTRLDVSLYLSEGRDFQYFVSTGDSIDTGGDIKPIVKRENISSVEIVGGELSIQSNPVKWLVLKGGYSQNHSSIIKYTTNSISDTSNLEGKSLAEVPVRQATAEAIVLSKFVNAGLVWVYIGLQWGDDVNSYRIASWNTFNLRLWQEYKPFRFTLDIQDLLNHPYTDKKGLISPGRFFQLAVTYSFK